jgi:class 3 adenylate cyclase
MSASSVLQTVLQQQEIEYAVCDADRHILEHSPGLSRLVSAAATRSLLLGQPIEDLFDELRGSEASLDQVARGQLPSLRIAHTCREHPDGQSSYLTLTVVPYAPGLLLIVCDTTQEGELVQRLMQRRNEVMLLQEQLQQVNLRLDYLIRHFVPDGVAQQLMAQPELPQPGGQRRVLSVLFADIRGYTALAEVLAPEDLMTMLNQQYSMIGGLIVEYGGVISHYVGDMIMAVFNALGDQADHAVRAVHAALDIQSVLSSLDKRKSQEDSSIITQFGIGINTGPAIVGYLGFEARFDYTVIGDMVNVAARLSSVAHSGEILINAQTYEAARGHIHVRPIGPMQLRGKANPLMVYEAINSVCG